LTVDKAKVALAPVLTGTKLGNLKAQDRLYKVVDRDGLYAVVNEGGALRSGSTTGLTVGEKHL
jgi:hypothetical protein